MVMGPDGAKTSSNLLDWTGAESIKAVSEVSDGKGCHKSWLQSWSQSVKQVSSE
jgi:hypothetical protein